MSQAENNTNVIFAAELRKLMALKGHTQVTLSKALDVAQSAVSNYLGGRLPKADILSRIASIYDVPIQSLLNGNAVPGSASISRAMLLAKAPQEAEAFMWKGRALAAERELAELRRTMRADLEALVKKI